MTCAAFDAQLEDYLAGRLPVAAAEALEAHAAECARCAPILEAQSRLDLALPRELTPDPRLREEVLARIASRGSAAQRRRWFVPVAIAAGVLLVLNLTRPPVKSGQRRPVYGSPAALAAESADAQFLQLDAARAELRAAIVKAPGDVTLQRALERLDAQRRSLENLIREFES